MSAEQNKFYTVAKALYHIYLCSLKWKYVLFSFFFILIEMHTIIKWAARCWASVNDSSNLLWFVYFFSERRNNKVQWIPRTIFFVSSTKRLSGKSIQVDVICCVFFSMIALVFFFVIFTHVIGYCVTDLLRSTNNLAIVKWICVLQSMHTQCKQQQ